MKDEGNSGQTLTRKSSKDKTLKTNTEYTNLDRRKFLGQFETESVCADITTVSEFSYLNELVIPKVRALIDGFPFNTEGYESE